MAGSKVSQLPSSTILSQLTVRLQRTNALRKAADGSGIAQDIEWEKALYTQYYFDFSTAIEAVLRGIVFEISAKTPSFGDYITYLAQQDSTRKAFFLDLDEVKALTACSFFNDNTIDREKDFESRFKLLAAPLDTNRQYQPLPSDEEGFSGFYRSVRKTRNTLAHGLIANDVSFDPETLYQFCVVFFLLFRFYENMERTSSGSNVSSQP